MGRAAPDLNVGFVVTDDRGTGLPTSGALSEPFNKVLATDGLLVYLGAGFSTFEVAGGFLAASDCRRYLSLRTRSLTYDLLIL